MLALLALAARFPEPMRQSLREMEQVYRTELKSQEEKVSEFLSDICDKRAKTALYPPDWEQMSAALKNAALFPADLTFRALQEVNLHLVSSFSFVGETDPDREAALRKGVQPSADGAAD